MGNMKMKRIICLFPNVLHNQMRKEAKQRQKKLGKTYGVSTLVRDAVEKEIKDADKKRVK